MRRKRVKSRQVRVKKLGILMLSFAIIAGCTDTTPTENAAGQVQSHKSVKAFKVIKRKIGDPLERAADVLSSVQFDVIAKAGGDIEQVLKKRGDVVQEGEVIVRLRSNEANFQRESASLAVKNAQDAIIKAAAQAKKEFNNKKQELNDSIQKTEQSLTELSRNYNKMRNDHDVGLVTKAQLYQAEVQLMNTRLDLDQLKLRYGTLEPADNVSELETKLKNAQIALQQIEQSMSYLEVKAQVSGLLTDIALEAGMTLQPGAHIGYIQKLDPIKIKAQVKEEESHQLTGKTELTYYLPGTKTKYRGKISFLSKVPDPQTKAYEINLDVPNKDMVLKPGMKLWLQLTEEQDQIVVTIPTYSIIKEGEDAYAFVLNGDSVEKREVRLGRLNEPHQEVLSGVKEGELVIVSGVNQLRDKDKVQLAAVEEQ